MIPIAPAARQLSDLSFVIDLDGTLIHGTSAAAGADDLMRLVGSRYVIVSNNSTHSVRELAGELATAGLDVPAEKLILAGPMAIRALMRHHGKARILVVGSASLRREAESAGLTLVDRGADVVLLGRDVAFTYEKLQLVTNEIRSG